VRISSEMLIIVVPTPSAERKAVSGSDRYCEVVQEPPESLARGMFPKGLSRNRRELPISSPKRRGTRLQGSTGGVADGSGAVVETHNTDEGGEPQGSRKGRPRDPLEGRGCPSGCIGRGKHSRDSELGCYVPRTRPPICLEPGEDP
jgi:hypothetical protein